MTEKLDTEKILLKPRKKLQFQNLDSTEKLDEKTEALKKLLLSSKVKKKIASKTRKPNKTKAERDKLARSVAHNSNPEFYEYFSYWSESGFQPLPNINTKTFALLLKRMSSLLEGNFFNRTPKYMNYSNCKVPIQDWIFALDRFKVYCFDHSKWPDDKDKLVRMSIYDFIYNDRTGHSWLIYCIENRPKSLVHDKDPKLTTHLLNQYSRLVGIDRTLLFPEQFVLIKNHIIEFFDRKKDRLSIRNSDIALVDEYMKSVLNRYSPDFLQKCSPMMLKGDKATTSVEIDLLRRGILKDSVFESPLRPKRVPPRRPIGYDPDTGEPVY